MSKNVKLILVTISLGLIGACVGYMLAKTDVISAILPSKGQLSGWTILYIFLIYFGVVIIHELGHLLTGLAQGFRFEMFIVWFLGIRRDGEKIKIYFNTDLSSAGGLAASSPRVDNERVIRQMANVIIAGPIASLLLLLLCILLFFLTNQPTQFYLFITGLMSLFIFLATTLPSRTGIFYTDRKRYQRLTGSGQDQAVEMAMIRANLLQVTGKSITQMSEGELWMITKDEAPIFKYIGYYYLYQYHFDKPEDLEIIKAHINDIEASIPNTVKVIIQNDLDRLEAERSN